MSASLQRYVDGISCVFFMFCVFVILNQKIQYNNRANKKNKLLYSDSDDSATGLFLKHENLSKMDKHEGHLMTLVGYARSSLPTLQVK